MDAQNISQTQHKNFTLIELLVVITILMILMTILLPVLGMAKERARTQQCASNQRQIGMAILLYAEESNGFMPQADKIDRTLGRDYGLSRDTGSLIWTCPSRNTTLSYVTDKNPVNYTFNLNGIAWVNSSTDGRKIERFMRTDQTLLFADGRENFSWGSWIFIDSTASFPYRNFDNKTWFIDHGHQEDDMVYVAEADLDAPGGPSGIRYRHLYQRSTAALFLDGHSEVIQRYGLRKRNFIASW